MNFNQQLEHSFSRTLGKRPFNGQVRGQSTDQLGLFVEAFGVPEAKKSKSATTLFWNFVRSDGAANFTLVSRVPNLRKPGPSMGRLAVDVQLIAGPGMVSFYLWTACRLNSIENNLEPPTVLNGANFVAAKMS